MILFLRAVLFAMGLLFVLAGVGFLLDPVAAAANFGLAATGPLGLSTLRADMTAFFVVAGAWTIWGAWRRNGRLLLVPTVLLAIAFLGRIVSALADGLVEGSIAPMIVELVAIVVLLVAIRLLPDKRVRNPLAPAGAD